MSLEYPCIYYRGNGLCSYGGDLTDANICVFGPCDHETPSRADRIRRMSDEKLAKWVISFVVKQFEKATVKTHQEVILEESANSDMLKWLQQPAEEDDRNG